MARLRKPDLIARAIDAIVADGWDVVHLSKANEHPARFTMEQDGVRHTVRLYAWNLSHGGKSRSLDEFRIQVTGVDGFEPEPNGRTLILGWSETFGVFAGFDVSHRLGTFGSSPSIQINASVLKAAASVGAGKQSKGGGEWAVAVRPDKIGRYVQHLPYAHAGELEPILADDGPATDALASEIMNLTRRAQSFDLNVPGEAQLRTRIAEGAADVLSALGERPVSYPAQIGHNGPPEPLDDLQLLGDKIAAAAEQVKEEAVSDTVEPRRIGHAGAFLAWARTLLDFAKEEGAKVVAKGKDMARDYMARTLWGAAATVAVAPKDGLIDKLKSLADSILIWLQNISVF